MGSLISMGDIWFVQALISLLFFFPYLPSLLIQLHTALIVLTSASYCFSSLLFLPLQAISLNMQDTVSCCGKIFSVLFLSFLLSIIKVM